MFAEADEITDVQVPHPSGSGTYSIITLKKIEERICDLRASMTGNPDSDNLLIRMESYLTGYRDALRNRRPTIL